MGCLFTAAVGQGKSFLTESEILHLRDLGCQLRSWLAYYGFGYSDVCNQVWHFVGQLEHHSSLGNRVHQHGGVPPIQRCETLLDLTKLPRQAENIEGGSYEVGFYGKSNTAQQQEGTNTAGGTNDGSNDTVRSGDENSDDNEEGEEAANDDEHVNNKQVKQGIVTVHPEKTSNKAYQIPKSKVLSDLHLDHLFHVCLSFKCWLRCYCLNDSDLSKHLSIFMFRVEKQLNDRKNMAKQRR